MSTNNPDKGKVIGTNCYNCKFVANNDEPVNQKLLNDEGGIDPTNEEEMGRSKKADLITLPGGSKSEVLTKKFCYNNEIKIYITIRMCCAYWDNDAVKRLGKNL